MEAVSRMRQSLDGAWAFRHESGEMRQALVPMPWQAQFADLRHRGGRAVYSRRFAAPDLAGGREAVLIFGAVMWSAVVRVNGQVVGQSDNGWLPFECPLPAGLLRAENLVEVECALPESDGFAEIPHGKQSWYGPFAGIWQSVWLEVRDPVHLRHCAIRADLSGRVSLDVALSAPAEVRACVLDAGGAVVAEGAELVVPAPRLWSPEEPNLYRLRVTLEKDGVRDVTEHVFGFRSFETRGGRFYLNGEPFYMRGALDQDYYPEGIATPPSLEFLEDQARKAKELGLNCLRCHIKVPDPRYYEVADRLGLLIWTEIPNVASFTAASARRMRETMEGILARDGNHPSIAIWTLINEDWGTRLSEDPAHRRWLADTYDWLKQRDPERLAVDNSACHGNFHVKTDINDFHYYRSIPERRAEWEALTEEFAGGAGWTYSPHGDAQRRGDEPLVVSEFGVWGLPQPNEVRIGGEEPWWMETGAAWGEGCALPHGLEERFASLQLDSVFGTVAGFVTAVQGYQFANLKYEIESMRARASIQGYVITELTDVHWESNGLLDMNRNVRSFHRDFSSINTDVVIVPRADRWSGWMGQGFRLELSVATGGQDLPAAELHWEMEGQSGSIAVPATPALSVTPVAALRLSLPMGGANRMLPVNLRLVSGGRELARNRAEIALYAPLAVDGLPTVGSADAVLAARAADLGLRVVALAAADVVLARILGPEDIARLQGGVRYLLLADGSLGGQPRLRSDIPPREQPFIPIVDPEPGLPRAQEAQQPNMALHARHGTMWRGDWIASFTWLRREGPFAAIPGGPLVDASFDRVIPTHVLTGFRGWEFGGPVSSGLVVGWAHKPAALIAARRVGRGALVASTYRLLGSGMGEDPVADTLFAALVQAAAGLATDSLPHE